MTRQPARRPPTSILREEATRPLIARAIRRTKPFQLHDVVGAPADTSFSARRFSAHSRLLGWGSLELELVSDPLATLGADAPLAFAEIIRLTAENTPYHAGTYMHQHLAQATFLVVLRRHGKPCGFSLATERTIEQKPFLFLNATMFGPELRGSHLLAAVNWLHFLRIGKRSFPGRFFVAYRTQNPLALAGGLASGPFYPRPGEVTPAAIGEAASRLSEALNPGVPFDRPAMVQRRVLARDEIDPARPRHHDAAINQLCDDHLDYEGGDLFLSVAEMSLWGVMRMGWVTLKKSALKRARASGARR